MQRDILIVGAGAGAGANGNGIAFSGGVGRLIADLIGERPGFASARAGHFDPFSPEFLHACAETRAKKRSGCPLFFRRQQHV